MVVDEMRIVYSLPTACDQNSKRRVLPLLDTMWDRMIAIDVVRGRDVANLVRVLHVGFDEISPVPAFDAVVFELLGGSERGEEDEQSDGVLVVDLVEGVIVGSQR